LGGIVAKKGNRGETLPWTNACGNGVGVGGCGGRHRITGSDLEAQLEWMRRSGFSHAKVRDYERTAKIGRILFMPGPFGIFGAVKWAIFRLVNLWKTIGMPPVFRQDLLKWATKSTSLACENLMIAAEALGLNTCPMEGFDGRRLSRFLGLSTRYHEIVMVIAIGKKSPAYAEPPQWRRPLDATVTVL
jgi:nitroreductase